VYLHSGDDEMLSVLQSFESANPLGQTPAKKPRHEKTFRSYTPSEQDLNRTFFIHVKNDWRDVRGFQLFEYNEETRKIEGDVMIVPDCKEWYCDKILEPPGGFKKGYGFVPKSKSWSVLLAHAKLLFDCNGVCLLTLFRPQPTGLYSPQLIFLRMMQV
jgi:hypothetical protein